ncbi:hypothetical protein M3Y99_00587600 [Aphelenchoides fujianensis]|nr:hypothetical protein M3Y99_00587600 [Aphelenchoides fujianensis]
MGQRFSFGFLGAAKSKSTDANNNAKKPKKCTHVIFDLDGTLIDSEEAYFNLQVACMRKFGKDFTIEQKRALLGHTTEEEVRELLRMNQLEDVVTVSDYLKMYEEMYPHYLSDCVELPGAERLIAHLHAARIPMAINTNSRAEHFEIKMRKRFAHWLQMIPLNVFAASDPEVKRPKPAPDSYLLTMQRFEERPESAAHCLVFEDSFTGARAAIDAGCTVILVPQSGFCNSMEMEAQIEKLRPQLAAVLPSLRDFAPQLFGLPAFKN